MLQGKTAVVTGSTSGIGLGIAEALARQGCHVALNSFTDTDEDRSIAARLGADYGIKAHYIQADMGKREDCVRLIETVSADLGPVQILVNNAGIQHVEKIEDFPPEKWDAIIAINLSSSFHTIRAAVPGLKAAGWGRIINMASTHGLHASPFKSAYVSAKHGLVGLTKTVALELAEFGVTCNAICPGYVKTPLVEAQIADQMKAHGLDREAVIRNVMLERQPTKQFAEIGQLAALAVFLCSDAAAQMTGQPVSVDGGWVAL